MSKRCFVIMGFGEKPDLGTGRTLDLDKTYRIIIKKAVEEAGLECIRADDIIHAGIIDKPMYELLLSADVVVADLSTSNANAIYELGVRHALRPYTTIVIAEKQFKFPFDIGHLLIRPYEHLGKGIDAEEAERIRGDIKKAITTLLDKQETDSPVFTFLPQLSGSKAEVLSMADPGAALASVAVDESATVLMDFFKAARSESDWTGAIRSLKKLLEKRPADEYLKQQLALATYKSKKPDPESALMESIRILEELDPRHTTDPETLGLWGAVNKRLWDLKEDRAHLDEAIWSYEKGFYLKNDHYNGINFAYLLNERASVSPLCEAIADVVTAQRIRRRIIPICEKLLASGVKDENGNPDKEDEFWVQATLVEALIGTGDREKAQTVKAKAMAGAPETWMADSMIDQLNKLESLLASAPDCNKISEQLK